MVNFFSSCESLSVFLVFVGLYSLPYDCIRGLSWIIVLRSFFVLFLTFLSLYTFMVGHVWLIVSCLFTFIFLVCNLSFYALLNLDAAIHMWNLQIVVSVKRRVCRIFFLSVESWKMCGIWYKKKSNDLLGKFNFPIHRSWCSPREGKLVEKKIYNLLVLISSSISGKTFWFIKK